MHWHTAFVESYNWLYAMGLWRDVIAVLVAAALGWVLRVSRRLKNIEHLLDTSKPGGLTDVVTAMNQQNNPPDGNNTGV